MYKQTKLIFGQTEQTSVIRTTDGACIPFDSDNRDFANFKKEINEDVAELQDADGNTMTADDAKSYVATLPQ
jgi:hypothetical protein